ncbi:galactose-3-O-sulfotransferase 3-like [Chrysemys picta bellii]|uniref:galactose-3-O-sulfotransferase 3-like n=1 Tax=Chrysemys picta bellii TaxID=8478 RepID=UPI0032B2460C
MALARLWRSAGPWRCRALLLAGLLLLLLRQAAKPEVGRTSPTEPLRGQSSARPPPNVVFVKTHKTGSSTLQNILFRLGERHNLTVAFPRYTYQFAYPQRFAPAFVEPLPPGAARYNLLVSHLRLAAGEVRRVMPPDSLYLTILRDPVRTFQSVFAYYPQHRARLPAPGQPHPAPAAFLQAPARYYDPADMGNGLARNPMAFDLGLEAGGEEGGSRWDRELERSTGPSTWCSSPSTSTSPWCWRGSCWGWAWRSWPTCGSTPAGGPWTRPRPRGWRGRSERGTGWTCGSTSTSGLCCGTGWSVTATRA